MDKIIGTLTRRDALKAGGALAAAGAAGPLLSTLGDAGVAAAAALPYTARTNVKGDITLWHFWGSRVRRTAIRRVIAEFNDLYPGVNVTETFVPFGDIWTKNIAAVAAGSGMPDVIVEDRPQLRTRAANKIDQSLQALAKRDNVVGTSFWPFTWEQSVVNGQVYGLPFETDIRVLYWNKGAFAAAGLDPERAPRDWNELWAFANRLDQKKGSQLSQVAFWPNYGNIGLDTWAWNNGGSWQDSKGRPTLNARPNVDTLAWETRWVDRYGLYNWQALQSTFGPNNQDGFMSGKVVMKVDIQGYQRFLNLYNPSFNNAKGENLGWGVAPIPPAPGHKPASFSGGFALSMPRGPRSAATTDAAWEFIKYAAFVGQRSWARDTYGMPTVVDLATKDRVLQADPIWKFFVQSMAYGRSGDYNPYLNLGDFIGPAESAALAHRQTPQKALDLQQSRALAELARAKK